MEKTGSHPHPSALNAAKGTMVRDMPADEKKPPSMMRTAREWLQNPWAKAAETRSLIERQVKAVTNGELLGARNADVAVDRVKKSLEMLKGGAKLEGLSDVLIPPPGKTGAAPARTGPTRAAWKLSNFFNTAALSFRDAAAQRPVPQFRFRGTPPDARWTEGALNTDLLRATLREQLSNRTTYSAEDLVGLLHVADLLLMSDHTLTPGAVEFCEEIRNALADEVAQCGALQAGEARLTDLLQATVRNAADHTASAYVLAKDVCAYAQARQAALGPSLSAVLQPAEAALLASIKAAPERFADLPEAARGQLREACHTLFRANETKEIFAGVDQKRLSTAVDKLKSVLENLPTDAGAAATGLEQAAVLARRIGGMRADLPKPLMTQASADIIASAARSKLVPAQGEALATALVSADKGAISTALTPIKPLLTLLSSLPEARDEQIAKAFMAASLEQFSLGDLDKFQAVLFAKPDPSAPAPEGLALFKRGIGGVMNASTALRKVSSHVESARMALGSAAPGAAQALSAALKKITKVEASTFIDPWASDARRHAVRNEIEALKASLRIGTDALVAHFEALDDIGEMEELHRVLTQLDVFAPPGAERKAQGQADAGAASQVSVEAALARYQDESQTTCRNQLRLAADALLATPFTHETAVHLQRALANAAQAESVSHRLGRLLGKPVDAATWRGERMAEVPLDASALTDGAREAAQDLSALLATVVRPAQQQKPSAIAERLDALNAYLTGFRLGPTEAISADRLRAAATTLQEACGIRIAHGVPIDASGLHRHMQSTLKEMLASAHAEKQGERGGSAVGAQAQKDLERTTIRLERNGHVETLHEAVAAGVPASGAAPSTITERLTRELGASGLWFTSSFMTQELLGTIVGEYLNANADSPLRHQFGERAQADVSGATTQVTIVPGDGFTTVRLSVRKDDCRNVKRDADVIDLDPENSHMHVDLDMEIQNDGSGVALRNFTFDMRQTELPPTAQAAARLYVDSFRAIAPGPGANAEPDLRDAVRERALARLGDTKPTPADPRAHAKSVVTDEFRRVPADRRVAYLEQALAVLPANESESPTDPLSLGVFDAIKKEYLDLAYEKTLVELGATVPEDHEVLNERTGVSRDFWVDYFRMHLEVRTGAQAVVSAGPYGEHNARNERRALTKLREVARALGGPGRDEAAGRQRLAQISNYTFQGLWKSISEAGFTPASPFRLNGLPLKLDGGAAGQRYILVPQDDGSCLIECDIRWRHGPGNPLMLWGPGAEGQIVLTDDSYAAGKLVIRVNADGSAETVEPITVETHFIPRATTTLGRMAQAIGSINLPSL